MSLAELSRHCFLIFTGVKSWLTSLRPFGDLMPGVDLSSGGAPLIAYSDFLTLGSSDFTHLHLIFSSGVMRFVFNRTFSSSFTRVKSLVEPFTS